MNITDGRDYGSYQDFILVTDNEGNVSDPSIGLNTWDAYAKEDERREKMRAEAATEKKSISLPNLLPKEALMSCKLESRDFTYTPGINSTEKTTLFWKELKKLLNPRSEHIIWVRDYFQDGVMKITNIARRHFSLMAETADMAIFVHRKDNQGQKTVFFLGIARKGPTGVGQPDTIGCFFNNKIDLKTGMQQSVSALQNLFKLSQN